MGDVDEEDDENADDADDDDEDQDDHGPNPGTPEKMTKKTIPPRFRLRCAAKRRWKLG